MTVDDIKKCEYYDLRNWRRKICFVTQPALTSTSAEVRGTVLKLLVDCK